MGVFFNPFSYRLNPQKYNKDSFGLIIYNVGDFCIYEKNKNHYCYTYKNIIIAERLEFKKQIIIDLQNNKYTGLNKNKYLNFVKPKETILYALKIINEKELIID